MHWFRSLSLNSIHSHALVPVLSLYILKVREGGGKVREGESSLNRIGGHTRPFLLHFIV